MSERYVAWLSDTSADQRSQSSNSSGSCPVAETPEPKP